MTSKEFKKSHSNVKRMSVTLSSDTAQLLEWLAETQGITQTETIRKAIVTEAYLYKEIKQGSKVLILTSDKKTQEIVFR